LKEDRERCLAAGMDDYVSKPVRVEELLGAIERIAARFSIEPRPDPLDEASAPVLDEEALRSSVRGNDELLRELIELFEEDADAMLADMKDAIAHGDAAALASSAHAFIGSLGNFAARRAYARARELERKARQRDWDGMDAVFEALVSETERLMDALSRLKQKRGIRRARS
jgi:HPt (histidine-containing phosphotransfer) domain-containing protein